MPPCLKLPPLEDQRGMFLIFLSLILSTLVILVGFAVDLGNFYQTRLKLDQITEAAALRAFDWQTTGTTSHFLEGTPTANQLTMPEDTIRTHIADHINANLKLAGLPEATLGSADTDSDEPTIIVNFQGNRISVSLKNYLVPTPFLSLLGANILSTSSAATANELPARYYFIIDTSPSMFYQDSFLRTWNTDIISSPGACMQIPGAATPVCFPPTSAENPTPFWTGTPAGCPLTTDGEALRCGSGFVRRNTLLVQAINNFMQVHNRGINDEFFVVHRDPTTGWRADMQTASELPEFVSNKVNFASFQYSINPALLNETNNDESNLCLALQTAYLHNTDPARARKPQVNFLVFSDGAISGSTGPSSIPVGIYQNGLQLTQLGNIPSLSDALSLSTPPTTEDLYHCAVAYSDRMREGNGRVFSFGFGTPAPEPDVRLNKRCNFTLSLDAGQQQQCQETCSFIKNNHTYRMGPTCLMQEPNARSCSQYSYCEQHTTECCQTGNCCGTVASDPSRNRYSPQNCDPYQNVNETGLRKNILLRRIANDPLRTIARFSTSTEWLVHGGNTGEPDCEFPINISPFTLESCPSEFSTYESCYRHFTIEHNQFGLTFANYGLLFPITPGLGTAAARADAATTAHVASKIIWKWTRTAPPIPEF